MFESDAKDRKAAIWITLHRHMAIIALNCVVWTIAVIVSWLAVNAEAKLVAASVVLSAGFGTATLPDRWNRASWLVTASGVASTALLLATFAQLTGFRPGLANNSPRTVIEMMAAFSIVYLILVAFIHTVILMTNRLQQKNKSQRG